MELENILKQHVDSVELALKGFEGKVATVQDAINEITAQAKAIETRLARPGVPGIGSKSLEFDGKLSFPEEERKQLGAILEGKAMSGLVEADGGYQVPEVIRNQIESLVLKQSPIRQVANVIQMPNRLVRLPVNLRGATGGWVGETATRSETSTPTLNEVTPTGGTVYALPKCSEELIEDAITNIEAFISENVVDTIAEMESQAFISGDGTNKPTGFLTGTPVATADASRAFGVLQYIATGAASTLGTALADKLLAMIFATKAAYRQADGCAWLTSTDVLSQIAQLKDTQGRPLYVPSLREGVPGTLFGYPVVECEHLPVVGANAFPMAFGNWRRGYVIGDRTPLNVLRDPYTVKGQILWYFRRRTYGAVYNSEAIKLLKVAAS